MKLSDFGMLLFRSFLKWQKHDATLRAAALTFFTIVPLPSLLLIAVALLAQFYGQEQALAQLITQVKAVAGPAVANLLSELLVHAQSPLTSFFGSFLAIVFALAGAIGALSVLQKSMDIIWETKITGRSRVEFVKEKMTPFALIVIIVTVVLVSTAVSNALLFLLNPYLGAYAVLLTITEILLSLGLGTLLFAIIFKMLPEAIIEWRDVWLAAFLTAIIFTFLNYFFGIYLSLVQVTTLEGTAGTLIVLFLWIYLTNLFILFGAQFSKVYAQTYGSQKSRLKPTLKRTPKPELERVEMKAEIDVKVKSASIDREQPKQ